MNKEYVKLAVRTESGYMHYARVLNEPQIAASFIHALRAFEGRAAELDKWKKLLMYGKQKGEPLALALPFGDEDLAGGIGRRLSPRTLARLMHAALGLATETGELLNALLLHVENGTPLDTVNLGEEIGDLFWYLALAMDELELDPAKVAEVNIAKLRARYPDRYEDSAAVDRDLAAERKILEGAD